LALPFFSFPKSQLIFFIPTIHADGPFVPQKTPWKI
jgi:hypothetical protein